MSAGRPCHSADPIGRDRVSNLRTNLFSIFLFEAEYFSYTN